jgi:hypothetical protein
VGGKTEQKTEQQQNSKTEPWDPAQPALLSLLNKATSLNTSVTPGQTAGLNALSAGASAIPNLGPQATGVATGLMGSTANPAYSGMLTDTLASLRGSLNPFASGSRTGPGGNPALRGYLDVARDDASNAVNGMFAGAGRDLSGAHLQALGRGITAAEAPILASQYNTDVGQQIDAAKALYGAGGATAGALQGLDQASIQNQLQGLAAAGAIPGLYTAPGTAQFAAANAANAQPFQNLGMLSSLVTPIAGLGAQSSGTMTSTQSQQSPWYTTALGLGMGGLGALGQSGAFGQSGWLTALLPAMTASDIRVKDGVRPIGMLFDSTPVYSFRYKGDDSGKTHVGLMAQDVERDRPEAVIKIGGEDGLRMVDYGAATDRAAALGMLHGVI